MIAARLDNIKPSQQKALQHTETSYYANEVHKVMNR